MFVYLSVSVGQKALWIVTVAAFRFEIQRRFVKKICVADFSLEQKVCLRSMKRSDLLFSCKKDKKDG